ncbi:MAG: 30S ribosomal protein S20 [bacterium]|nr:30S ribosomal protein S20 [bacterium]
MPITKSAKKALRQNISRRARNIKATETLKRLVKDLKKAVLANNTQEAQRLLAAGYKAFDKASKTGLLKKNTVSRKKSSLAKLLSGKKQGV